MAKITVNMDTETKEMDVSIDGKSLNDVVEARFSCYCDDGTAYCELMQSEKLEGDMRKYTRLCASESEEGKKYEKMGYEKTVGGFISVPEKSSVQRELSKLYEKF